MESFCQLNLVAVELFIGGDIGIFVIFHSEMFTFARLNSRNRVLFQKQAIIM